jgi:DNA polymerase-3 subunit epsilon
VLCTVRLSRKLYPQHRRHNLDSIIARHGLSVGARHRALDDARLLWQFWQSARRDFSDEHIAAAVAALSRRQHWPDHLDPELPSLMPDSHGVYVFYDGAGQALYVGKADKLRAQILAHFQPMQRRAKAQRLAEQVRRVEWVETGGMLGALLHENRLVHELVPLHNRRSRSPAVAAAQWPYRGPIGVREGGMIHVVHDWQFLGSATRDEELYELLEHASAHFDPDVHRILRERIRLAVVIELGPR